jgi:hypothetical protein
MRRTTFESFAAGVDWTDVGQVERALRVFESQLRWLARPSQSSSGDAEHPILLGWAQRVTS